MKLFSFTFITILLLVHFSCKKDDVNKNEQFFYLRNNGADMPVWVEGNVKQEKFIIVVHGGPGGEAQIYNTGSPSFSNPLEKEFAMVYYDQRGSGNAMGRDKSKNYSLETYADDLEKLVDLIKFRYGNSKKVYLLGHSWGGTLTAYYLINNKRRAKVRAWIEVDGAHNFSDNKTIHKKILEESGRQYKINSSSAEWSNIYNDVNNMNPNNLTDNEITKLNAYGFEMESLLTPDSINNTTSEASMKYLKSLNILGAQLNLLLTNTFLFDELKTSNLTPQLNVIDIPCLFMWGKHDFVVPIENGFEAYNIVSTTNKLFLTYNRSGHSPMLNEAPLFTSQLINWVKLN